MIGTKSVFFELIESVVFDRKANPGLKAKLTDDVVGKLFAIAKKHDLAHIIGLSLAKLGVNVNDELNGKLQKEQMLAVFRYERLKYDYELLLRALENFGVEFIPLKGAIIRDFYPEPWMRTSCDIDVLVKKEDAERTVLYLTKNGFAKGKDFTEHDHILTSESGTTIELHYNLRQDGALPKSDEILDSVWENLKDKENDTNQRQMTDEFFVFYHLVHMAKHFINGGCGIRPFIDLFLINKNIKCDQEKLKELLIKAELDKFYSAVLELSKVWFEGEKHTNFTTVMEEFVLSGGVYGNINNSAKVQAVKGKTKSKTIFSLMFLPKSRLEIIYPRLKKYPILFPFYQVKRWFRVFKKDNRNRVSGIVKARGDVMQEDINSTEQLIDALGLK